MNKQLLLILTLLLLLLLSISFYSFSQITFQKNYGTSNYNTGYFVQQTFDGGYILSNTKGINMGTDGIALIKINSTGDTVWTKAYGGLIDYAWGATQQTADSGFIITGYTNSNTAGIHDIFLIKTDLLGNIMWAKTYGGNDDDEGTSVQQTYDGGFIVTGRTGGIPSDIFFMKTDSIGNPTITKTYGSSSGDYVNSIRQTADSGYILTGRFGSNDISCLIKTDINGNVSWKKTYDATISTYGSVGNSVLQTSDGGYLFVGFIYLPPMNSAYVVRTNPTGDTLWTRIIGSGTNFDEAFCVQKTFDNEYIIAGYTLSYGAGDVDIFLIKMDDSGNISWSKTYGGTGSDAGSWVQQASDSGYVIAGYSFDVLNSAGVFLVKTDVNGNTPCNVLTVNPAIISSPVIVNIPSITTTSPSISTSAHTFSVSSKDTVVTLCSSLNVNEIDFGNSFDISPNPSKGSFIVSFQNQILRGNVNILNILGENVYTENIFNESKKEINLKNIACGIYFVKMFDGEKGYCKKLIVEHD